MNIHDNIPLNTLKPSVNTGKSNKEIAINRAITEVNLNTPDSIELAIETLKSKHVEVPHTLIKLQALHSKFQMGRNNNFVQESLELQIKVLKNLDDLLITIKKNEIGKISV